MPLLNFPLSPDGLALSVMIGPHRGTMITLQTSGQPVPPLVMARALVDTGTDASAVAPSVPARLGLAPIRQTTTQTTAGPLSVNVFEVSLSIPGPVFGQMLTRQRHLVTELPYPPPGVEALIGLDVLSECLLIYDGPAKQFTLAF